MEKQDNNKKGELISPSSLTRDRLPPFLMILVPPLLRTALPIRHREDVKKHVKMVLESTMVW